MARTHQQVCPSQGTSAVSLGLPMHTGQRGSRLPARLSASAFAASNAAPSLSTSRSAASARILQLQQGKRQPNVMNRV